MPEISGVLAPVIRFPGQNKLRLGRASNFTFERAPETTELRRRPDCSPGLNTTSAEVETAVTWTISYDSPAFDGVVLSEFLDQEITITPTNIAVPTLICSALDTASTPGGLMTVTGLTANQVAQASLATDYDQEQLIQVTAAPAAANEFQVVANGVQFFAAQVDVAKSARFVFESTQALNEFIGGPAALAPWGSREFLGVVAGLDGGDPWWTWWANCSPTGTRSFGTGDDEISNSYKASIPSAKGWNSPFLAWRAPFSSVAA